MTTRVVVIGAGIGGLTTAAVLAKAGLDVVVLESQAYPGGCAGTFVHKGYRFDAGATLAAGFDQGGVMELVAHEAGIRHWPTRPADAAMLVHLSDGTRVVRRGDDERWSERRRAFGEDALRFWHWQEATADALWSLALACPPWPPQSATDVVRLGRATISWAGAGYGKRVRLPFLLDAGRPVTSHLRGTPRRLRELVDAQLLISAQATSRAANALYAAAALDMPRRGPVHVAGGMGGIATAIADAAMSHGAVVYYKHEVTAIRAEAGLAVAVETSRGAFDADVVVVNLPAVGVRALVGDVARLKLRRAAAVPPDGWGAFTMYLGVDASVVPDHLPLRHQVIVREPYGEGNTLFMSVSPRWDPARAPAGRRAITISTHTRLDPWWQARRESAERYGALRKRYAQRLTRFAERAMPGLSDAVDVSLPGTPVTFERFTGRHQGWVGGYPQTSLTRTRGPRIGANLWMVGDSVFPGQSTAAVALGAVRVAGSVLSEAANS